MKRCVLCSFAAKTHCESDEASLCWDCDEKVHSANFLVAKHSRTLLCHLCQSSTPWQGSGPKLALTVSVCQMCVLNAEHQEEESQGAIEDDDTNDDGEYSDTDDEEEDGENQVVPWSSFPSPPPVVTTSTRLSTGVSSFKRIRENSDLDSQDDIGCSSSSSRFHHNVASTTILSSTGSEDDEATSLMSLATSRIENMIRSQGRIQDRGGEAESRAVSVVNSVKRFQRSMIAGDDNQSAAILEICKFSRDA